MMRRKLAVAGVLFALATVLTGCNQVTGDREAGGGKGADRYEDATNVVVYRNADNVPNVAYFCLGEQGWASTLSGTDTGSDKAATLVRFDEYDPTCLDGASTAQEPTEEELPR